MGTEAGLRVTEVGPRDAWEILSKDAAAVLVDVRTEPEWSFVGLPDLSGLDRDVIRLAWKSWPDMSPNPAFVGSLMERTGDDVSRYLFICRSGARSMQAAQAVADALPARGSTAACINVAEGFEGDLDDAAHRGALTGWKARGLAWRQS
jgi:rhodanese-related sulfurtransferase